MVIILQKSWVSKREVGQKWWQDGFGVEKPKTAEQQQIWLPCRALIKTIPLTSKNSSSLINLCRLSLLNCLHLFNFLFGCCCCSQKKNVLFILAASHLLHVPPRFLRLECPQRSQRRFAPLRVTICRRWEDHVTLLLTVECSPHKMLELNSFSQLDGGPTFL